MKVRKPIDLFANIIKSLYSAEGQLEKELPKLAKKATDRELAKEIEAHVEVTARQRERLEKIAEILDFTPRGKKCIAMEGILQEIEVDLNEIPEGELMDPDLIIGAQKVEHYEIASYGSACALAKHINNEEVLKLLLQTLEEEKMQDMRLTQMAERAINEKALHA
ncbi:MAG: ferritin-like domain-containing protein [Cytophagaceae bacterium]